MSSETLFEMPAARRDARTRRSAAVFRLYEQLERTQWVDPAELEQLALGRFRALLGHSFTHVPYYRRLLQKARVVPGDIRCMADVRRLPILTRRTYQERFGEFQATTLPSGMMPAGRLFTSGSSGVPVTVQQTTTVRRWFSACHLRDLGWTKVDPRGRVASIRYYRPQDGAGAFLEGLARPSWGEPLDELMKSGPSFVMDIHQDPRRQLEWLRGINPDYLVSYPSNLEFLAGLIEEDGRSLPGLRVIKSLSEALTEPAQRRIEAAFGAPVMNTYSCMEAGYLASPCPSGTGLHVHAEHVLFEVLDERGEPCRPGECGRVVITTLNNFLTPLIRYEIMDGAAFAEARCPCGRGLPLIERPVGKTHPLFHLPNGRFKNSMGLAVAMRKIGGSRQFKITQRTLDRVVVEIVPDRAWSGEHEGLVRAAIREFFEAHVSVEIVTREHLGLDAGGKSRHLVCELETSASVHERAKGPPS